MDSLASHSFEEHTGEVRLRLNAPTREALFAEAGRALAELMLGERPALQEVPVRQSVEVRAPERASLLVEWLNELVFLSETTQRVFTRFDVERVDDTEARATAWGIAPDALKTAVKAATLHALALEKVPGGWQAQVVLDV